jgi:hypothetical protein
MPAAPVYTVKCSYTKTARTERGGSPVKKMMIVLALLVALIPAAAFADFQIGATAFVDKSLASLQNKAPLTQSDLYYGLDTRLKLWILQASVQALYSPPETILALTDVGVALDVLFLRVGLGVGPILGFDTQGGGSAIGGWNLKTSLDLNLGNLGLGISAFTFGSSPSDLIQSLQDYTHHTELAVSLLFKLF